MFRTLAPKIADGTMSLQSTLSYVLAPCVRAAQLPLSTYHNIPEASLRYHMDTRIWRNGRGCLCSTQLSKDSGCLRLLRLSGWCHHQEADGEDMENQGRNTVMHVTCTHVRWVELSHMTIHDIKEVRMCSFSGCPGRGEKTGVLVLRLDLFKLS